MNTDIYRKLKT